MKIREGKTKDLRDARAFLMAIVITPRKPEEDSVGVPAGKTSQTWTRAGRHVLALGRQHYSGGWLLGDCMSVRYYEYVLPRFPGKSAWMLSRFIMWRGQEGILYFFPKGVQCRCCFGHQRYLQYICRLTQSLNVG